MNDLKIYAQNLESAAMEQIETLVNAPAFEGARIRIMPDAHAGAGCVIGFTANLGDKVVPNLVGVDIGCGMLTSRIEFIEECHLDEFDAVVRKSVPSGFSVHSEQTCDVDAMGLLCRNELQNVERLERSMGTLGGGNHFVEIDAAGNGDAYLVVHSGSRNRGLQVASIYQRMAVETCKEPTPKGLEYLTGELRDAYLHDMHLCERWAGLNREAMMHAIYREARLGVLMGGTFHTVHNYIGDDGIVRKGAISAQEGERVLIPLNMRDGSVLGVGRGNEDWNNSAPHGAGRAMSRARAKRELSVDGFREQMANVYSSTVCEGTLDEAPDAYKPAQQIVDALYPTVKVEKRLYPVYNFKAVEQKRERRARHEG